MATEVTDSTFKKFVLDSKRPVIVDIWAPWCQPCKQMDKDLAEIEATYAGRVTIVKVNADNNPQLVSSLEIKSVPTLLFYHNGSAAPRSIVGAVSSKQIVSRFRLSELSS